MPCVAIDKINAEVLINLLFFVVVKNTKQCQRSSKTGQAIEYEPILKIAFSFL
jgi:hypothetical protein